MLTVRSLFLHLSSLYRASPRAMDLFFPLLNPSSFTILVCIILPSLCARDLRGKVRLLPVYAYRNFAFSSDSSLDAVSVVVSRSHIAMVKQNPQWPVPRYTKMPLIPKGPAFVCLARHKITDVTSLVCDLGFLISLFLTCKIYIPFFFFFFFACLFCFVLFLFFCFFVFFLGGGVFLAAHCCIELSFTFFVGFLRR